MFGVGFPHRFTSKNLTIYSLYSFLNLILVTRARDALFMAETMTGYKGNTRHALPLDQTLDILEWYHGEK